MYSTHILHIRAYMCERGIDACQHTHTHKHMTAHIHTYRQTDMQTQIHTHTYMTQISDAFSHLLHA